MRKTARSTRATEHPALPLMRQAAQGHLTRFLTDLTVHDASALGTRPPTDAFGWILHSGATWLALMSTEGRPYAFAKTFVHAYGPDDCRFYFWTGTELVRYKCAADLDERIYDHERHLRERKRDCEPADRGVV